MSYDNPDFVAAVKKVLRDSLAHLTNSFNDLKEAVTAHWQTDEKRYQTKPVSVTDLRTDVPIRVQTEAKRSKPENVWRYIIGALEAAAFVAVIGYTILTYQIWEVMGTANDVSMGNFRRTRIDANGQLKQALAQTDLSRKGFDEAVKNFRVDQRGWIVITQPDIPILSDQGPAYYKFQCKNIGKTPVKRLRIDADFEILEHTKAPNLCDKEPCYAGIPHTATVTGIVYPNDSFDFNVDKRRDNLITNKDEPALLTRREFLDLRDGRAYTAVPLRLTYFDIFGVQHWQQFCFWNMHYDKTAPPTIQGPGGAVIERYFNTQTCSAYNDADSD